MDFNDAVLQPFAVLGITREDLEKADSNLNCDQKISGDAYDKGKLNKFNFCYCDALKTAKLQKRFESRNVESLLQRLI